MRKELETLKEEKQHIANRSKDFDNRSTLNVNGHLRFRRRRRSSNGLLRTCHTCNKPIDNEETKSADESETVHGSPVIHESKSWNGSEKDNVTCKHHSLKKKMFMHSQSSPNLLNKSSKSPNGSSADNTISGRRLSKICDIPDISVTDMSETEKTDNETNTLSALENILALESDTGLSEMDENSDKSSDDDNDI